MVKYKKKQPNPGNIEDYKISQNELMSRVDQITGKLIKKGERGC